jgi:S1-C subfamily serine protease
VPGLRRRDSFTLDSTEMPQGAGSGIIWDDEGHVVTNLHVSRVLTGHSGRRCANT